jgi:hypothetical protein
MPQHWIFPLSATAQAKFSPNMFELETEISEAKKEPFAATVFCTTTEL